MKIIITGSCGFIGKHISEKLLQNGHAVIGIDNYNSYIYDHTFKQINLECLKTYKNFKEINDDILNGNYIQEHDPDIVIHLAAYANVRKSIEEPDKYIRNNVECTCKILNEITKCKKNPLLIYASSSSVYGANTKIPFEETDILNNIISPYALSKKMCEDLVDLFCKTRHIRAIGLRFFTVYGPGGRPDMGIYKFLKNIHHNQPVTIFGDGTMQRDFTYISDIVDGIYSCTQLCLNEKEHRIYNIGNNSPITLSKLIKTCEDIIGKKATIINLNVPEGDVPITYANIDKAKHDLNFQPKIDIYEGLKNMYIWYLNLTFKD
jgi:UDP-glucuronate 4-epimerase